MILIRQETVKRPTQNVQKFWHREKCAWLTMVSNTIILINPHLLLGVRIRCFESIHICLCNCTISHYPAGIVGRRLQDVVSSIRHSLSLNSCRQSSTAPGPLTMGGAPNSVLPPYSWSLSSPSVASLLYNLWLSLLHPHNKTIYVHHSSQSQSFISLSHSSLLTAQVTGPVSVSPSDALQPLSLGIDFLWKHCGTERMITKRYNMRSKYGVTVRVKVGDADQCRFGQKEGMNAGGWVYVSKVRGRRRPRVRWSYRKREHVVKSSIDGATEWGNI